MDIDITPHILAPSGTDLNLYKQTLIERFANHKNLPAWRFQLEYSVLSNFLKINEGIVFSGIWAEAAASIIKIKTQTILINLMFLVRFIVNILLSVTF